VWVRALCADFRQILAGVLLRRRETDTTLLYYCGLDDVQFESGDTLVGNRKMSP